MEADQNRGRRTDGCPLFFTQMQTGQNWRVPMTQSEAKCVAIDAGMSTGCPRVNDQATEAILREAAAVERECRLAILTSFLPEDELIGRMRASIIAAESRKAGNR
jgi:hypothetical protein